MTANGWQRNHGPKYIQEVSLNLVREKKRGDKYISARGVDAGWTRRPRDGRRPYDFCASFQFVANATLGGDYLFRVSFTKSDLLRLLELGTRDMSLGEVMDALARVRERANFNPALDVEIGDLDLSSGTKKCLQNNKIKYVGDLVKLTEDELFRLPNVGRKRLDEIIGVFVETYRGLDLGADVGDWYPPDRRDM